jgi:cytochrome c553
MRHPFITLLLASASLLAGHAALADAKAGRQKAQVCTTCHGPLGFATMANTPHLAGQPALYLIEQLKAFRSGKRPHEVMSLMAKPLTDDDIENLSEWFSSMQVEVKEKP